MHLRGILWVIFRVLLVGFGLFGPGAARAPFMSPQNGRIKRPHLLLTLLRNLRSTTAYSKHCLP